MNELQQVLNDIKQDKNTNLLPGNLRDNVTCLGIEGTAEVPTPIYATTDYTIKSVNSSIAGDNVNNISVKGQYCLVSSRSSRYLELYKITDSSLELLQKITSPNSGAASIVKIEDNVLYIVQVSSRTRLIGSYAIDSAQWTTVVNQSTNSTQNIIMNYYDTDYFICYNSGSTDDVGNIYKLNDNNDNFELVTTTPSRSINLSNRSLSRPLAPNLFIAWNYSTNAFMYLSKCTLETDDWNVQSIDIDNIGRIVGASYDGTKVFILNKGVYALNSNLSVGEKLADLTIDIPSSYLLSAINDKYYILTDYTYINKGINSLSCDLYEFDNDTNTFTYVNSLQNVVFHPGHIASLSPNTSLADVYDFISGDTQIGVSFDGKNYYYSNSNSVTSDKVISGYEVYTKGYQPIIGTMPNNGELNITPTTENQNIPEGYTSGGTVLGDENLKSENIKKDVSIFGVTGSLESSLGGVKLFETEEEMQADDTAKLGDLAIVYKNEIQNMTVDTQTQYITFPETVVLPDAITSDYRCTYKYIDDTPGSFSVRLDDNTFSFSKRGTPRINITYTSVDGITYNRDEFTINTFEELTNPVDLDGVIHINLNTQWNDNFGYFMQIGGMTFKGLYNYGEIIHNDYIQLSPISSVSFDYENKEVSNINYTGEVIGEPISIEKVKSIYNSISEDIGDLDLSPQYEIFLNKSQELYLALGVNNHEVRYFYTTTDCQPLGFGESINSSLGMYVYRIDLENNSYELVDSVNGTGASAYSYIPYDDILTIPIMIRTSSTIPQIPTSWRIIDSSSTGATNLYLDDYIGAYPLYKSDEYQLAPTQLNATSEYVYEKEFYGKNGVETGTLGTPDNSFADTNAEIVYKIQNQYENMEPRVLTDDNKTIDKNMYFIPVKKDGTPLLDTSSVTTMEDMFNGCTNLTEIPLLNTSSAVNMQSMFMGCTNLQNISDLDTSKATNMSYMFHGCTNLATIPLLDTSKVTDIRSMFENCEHLMTVPDLNTSSATNMYSLFSGCASLTSIPLLDVSNVTDVAYMFAACTNLVTIPQLDTSKVTNMMYMFMKCTNLSDDSLNNVLAMCANATLYTGTKTLKYIGISEEQATKCTTLSNYEMFTSAGWTTGY